MSNNIAIKVENLSKIYRLYNSPLDRLKEALSPLRQKYHYDFYALKGIDFEVKKGETIGIIGKNGSGKSTLLKIISGVLNPTNGSVLVNGKISALLELGTGFNPELTGIENVYFNGTLMGYNKEEMDSRLDNILGFADIGGFVHQPVKTYSSGMFVRLAFAVAINVDPDILIVDEALSVGDIKFQRKCFSKIEDFRDSNKTIIFVTHESGRLATMCDSSILLNNGLLIEKGEPNLVTKAYMQLIFGELESDKQEITMVDSDDNKDNCNVINTEDIVLVKTAIELIGNNVTEANNRERRHGNYKALIIDYGIIDKNDNKAIMVFTGEKCIIYYTSVFLQAISRVFSAIIIKNVYGIELFFTNSDILKSQNLSQSRGDILECKFAIEMWLAPGDYFLSFVLRDNETNEYLDRRLDAFHFKVVSSERNCGGYVNLMPTLVRTTQQKNQLNGL